MKFRFYFREKNLVTLGLLGLCLILYMPNAFSQKQAYTLGDFYKYDAQLAYLTDSMYDTLNDQERVAQMIVTSAGELGKPTPEVKRLVQNNLTGGIVLLKGTKQNHKKLIDDLNQIAKDNNQLPLLFSIDGEPSLYNGRVQGTPKMINTIDIKDNAQCDSVVHVIDSTLIELGIHHNYAPVCDISPDNEAIKNRSFGSDQERLISLCETFISSTQADNIVATAKHFPGHGLVSGDTHKQSVYINGDLQELDIYRPLIDQGVISIMVAHITVENNELYGTNGLPSTCSPTIVTELLKKELGFKGIIITDALNIMKAVNIIENAPLKASKAGCDMILMPINEQEVIEDILNEIKIDKAYKARVEQSVKKIIRLKICLGLV